MKKIRRLFFLGLIFFLGNTISAQVKPDYIPEDIRSDEIGEGCYCKPGVRNKSRSKGLKINYGWIGEGTYKEEDNSLVKPFSRYRYLRHLEVDLKVPIINKEKFKLLIGYKYFSEDLNFNRIGVDFSPVFEHLDEKVLKSNSYSIIISKPLNETKYIGFRFRYSSNGDYQKWMTFKKEYGIYKFLGLYAKKPHEDFEWAIGLNISKSFRRMNILPFVVINKNFNSKWGMETVLPGYIYGRYNINARDILLFGAQYGSRSYRIDLEGANRRALAYAFNHSELVFSTILEHQFIPWVWGNLKLGYQMNFSSDFDSKNDNSAAFNAEPTDALYFQIGIFISPPKRDSDSF